MGGVRSSLLTIPNCRAEDDFLGLPLLGCRSNDPFLGLEKRLGEDGLFISPIFSVVVATIGVGVALVRTGFEGGRGDSLRADNFRRLATGTAAT